MANEILKKKMEKLYESYYTGYHASMNNVEPTVVERKEGVPISWEEWGTKKETKELRLVK